MIAAAHIRPITRKGARMMRRSFLALAAMALFAMVDLPRGWADQQLVQFAGLWKGASLRQVSGPAGEGVTAARMSVEIEATGSRLKLRWTMIDWDHAEGLRLIESEAEFEATERPAVFQASDMEGDMFDDSDNGNPLAGKPMLWARIDGPSLTVYGLRVAESGSFVIDQFALELIDGGMAFDFHAVADGVERAALQGHLVRGEE